MRKDVLHLGHADGYRIELGKKTGTTSLLSTSPQAIQYLGQIAGAGMEKLHLSSQSPPEFALQLPQLGSFLLGGVKNGHLRTVKVVLGLDKLVPL